MKPLHEFHNSKILPVSEIPKNFVKLNNGGLPGGSLDTIAHLTSCPPQNSPQNSTDKPTQTDTYKKRAIRKIYGDYIKKGLASLPGSPLQKSYFGSCLCAASVVVSGSTEQTAVSKYCKARWCLVCGAIRTAKSLNAYLQPLQDLKKNKGLYLVTLTRPNVSAFQLPAEIEYFYTWWRDYTKLLVKRKLRASGLASSSLDGIRKFECTYNVSSQSFHPHFHIIVSCPLAAKNLLDYWLQTNPTANKRANDLRPLGSKPSDLVEVFKYATKLSGKLADKKEVISLAMLDVINVAIRNRRIIQPFGSLRAVKVDIENLNDIEAQATNEFTQGIYTWFLKTWHNVDTSQPLVKIDLDNKQLNYIDILAKSSGQSVPDYNF